MMFMFPSSLVPRLSHSRTGEPGNEAGLYDVHVTSPPSPDVADVRYGLDGLQVAKTEASTLAYNPIFVFQ